MTFAESALNFVLVAAHHSIVRTCSIHKSKQDRGFFFIMYLKCQSDRISGPLIPASIDKLPFFCSRAQIFCLDNPLKNSHWI